MKPRIGITMGDPAGVGPEILLKSLSQQKIREKAQFFILGDLCHLEFVKKKIKKASPKLFSIDPSPHFPRTFPNKNGIPVVNFKNVQKKKFKFGVVSSSHGYASGVYIKKGIELALKKQLNAIVTCPIHKVSFRKGGWGNRFTDHTEMLEALTQSRDVAMMMVTGNLRSIHVSSHIPLRSVHKFVKKKRIQAAIQLAQQGLKLCGIKKPKIAVGALNPHAGDDGVLGTEEKKEILPAVKACQKKKINVVGPIPSDAMWPQVKAGVFDIGVAMYHDQGQIPVKLEGFQFSKAKKGSIHGVNVTLGLPIIRTSPGHGTAFDIAGKGWASEKSLVEAIELAIYMAKNKK